MAAATKRLYKSSKDRVLTGVLGGLGEYFNIDAVILRLLWLVIVIFTGLVPGLVVYVVAALIIPEKK